MHGFFQRGCASSTWKDTTYCSMCASLSSRQKVSRVSWRAPLHGSRSSGRRSPAVGEAVLENEPFEKAASSREPDSKQTSSSPQVLTLKGASGGAGAQTPPYKVGVASLIGQGAPFLWQEAARRKEASGKLQSLSGVTLPFSPAR